MNQAKIEIEKYLKEKHDYFLKEKSKANTLHEIRLYSNKFTEFVKHLQNDILEILHRNGITEEKEINELIDSFKIYTEKIIKDISI